jgi:hypothetical protein
MGSKTTVEGNLRSPWILHVRKSHKGEWKSLEMENVVV